MSEPIEHPRAPRCADDVVVIAAAHGTPNANRFHREKWSKGWAYSDTADKHGPTWPYPSRTGSPALQLHFHHEEEHGNARTRPGRNRRSRRGLTDIGERYFSLIDGVAAVNDLLNTPIVSWIGQTADRIGFGLKEVHFTADAIGYAASKAAANLGAALGGTGSVDYHFEKKWHSAPLLH